MLNVQQWGRALWVTPVKQHSVLQEVFFISTHPLSKVRFQENSHQRECRISGMDLCMVYLTWGLNCSPKKTSTSVPGYHMFPLYSRKIFVLPNQYVCYLDRMYVPLPGSTKPSVKRAVSPVQFVWSVTGLGAYPVHPSMPRVKTMVRLLHFVSFCWGNRKPGDVFLWVHAEWTLPLRIRQPIRMNWPHIGYHRQTREIQLYAYQVCTRSTNREIFSG